MHIYISRSDVLRFFYICNGYLCIKQAFCEVFKLKYRKEANLESLAVCKIKKSCKIVPSIVVHYSVCRNINSKQHTFLRNKKYEIVTENALC